MIEKMGPSMNGSFMAATKHNRYNSNDRTMAIPSRVDKRNQDLKLLSYMQRSKKLNKNFYQPIEWSTQ